MPDTEAKTNSLISVLDKNKTYYSIKLTVKQCLTISKIETGNIDIFDESNIADLEPAVGNIVGVPRKDQLQAFHFEEAAQGS